MEQVRDGPGHSRRGCSESIARAAAPLARGPRPLRKVSKDENIKGLLRWGAGHLEVSNFEYLKQHIKWLFLLFFLCQKDYNSCLLRLFRGAKTRDRSTQDVQFMSAGPGGALQANKRNGKQTPNGRQTPAIFVGLGTICVINTYTFTRDMFHRLMILSMVNCKKKNWNFIKLFLINPCRIQHCSGQHWAKPKQRSKRHGRYKKYSIFLEHLIPAVFLCVNMKSLHLCKSQGPPWIRLPLKTTSLRTPSLCYCLDQGNQHIVLKVHKQTYFLFTSGTQV